MKPHVTCILLNYNQWQLTQDCISSIAFVDYSNLTVLVIDNQSKTHPKSLNFKSIEYPVFDAYYKNNIISKKSFKRSPFFTIQSDINGGFSYGINIGIKIAIESLDTDYIWILNNDTICSKATLQTLVDQASPTTIIGSKLVSLHGKPLRSSGQIHPLLGTSSVINSKNKKMDYIPFTSVLFSQSLAKEIGPLDVSFFLYYEDADFCYRAVNKGFSLSVCQLSIIIHNESYTTRCSENQSLCPDWLPIYSRKIFMKNHGFHPILIFLSLMGSFIKRIAANKFRPAVNILMLIYNPRLLLRNHHYYRK
ncbi:MAG: glycosyltransferase family 2 protein [Candidatus Marinamargulisbacteria bacterium]